MADRYADLEPRGWLLTPEEREKQRLARESFEERKRVRYLNERHYSQPLQYKPAPAPYRGREIKKQPPRDWTATDWLRLMEIPFVDKRPKGGALWVPDPERRRPIAMRVLAKKFGLQQHFTYRGGKATGYAPGWWFV